MDFISFSTKPFFSFRIADCIQLTCSLGLHSVTMFGLPLSFLTLMVLKNTGQVFCRLSLNLGLPDGWVCCDYIGNTDLGENHREELPFSLHLIRGTWHQYDLGLVILTLSTWLSSISGFSTYCFSLHTLFFRRASLNPSHNRGGGECILKLHSINPYLVSLFLSKSLLCS